MANSPNELPQNALIEGDWVNPRDGYKIWFDLSIISLAHIVLFPVWIALWIVIPTLIWMNDRGPIFYKQPRLGKHGETIKVIKFRTMVVDAASLGPAWTLQNDPRITRIGRFLRKTALDELPELISIIKRDMSLVGPRALDVREQKILESEIPGFERRLVVSPGLTGLAQIYDKFDIAQDKLRYDLLYINKMSVWLDLMILVLSVRNTLLSRWDNRDGKIDQ